MCVEAVICSFFLVKSGMVGDENEESLSSEEWLLKVVLLSFGANAYHAWSVDLRRHPTNDRIHQTFEGKNGGEGGEENDK